MVPTGMVRSRLLPALLVVLCGCPAPAPRTTPVPTATGPAAPVATARPHQLVSAHGTRVDPYYWLRDDSRQSPEVLAYLEAENAYTAEMLAPSRSLHDELYREIVARIEPEETSVPTLEHGYWYYHRFEAGKERPIYARRKGSMTAPEEILLDANQLAESHDYYKIGGLAVSPDGKLVAYAEDTTGRLQHRLRIKDLSSGELRADSATNITSALEWAGDNQTLFYVGKHPTTLLEYRVFRHTIGAEADQDLLVYEEQDPSYYVSIGKTKSEEYITIDLDSTESTESWLIEANHPTVSPRRFFPRERGHEYQIDHLDSRFVIRTNWKAPDFRLMEIAEADHENRARWRDVIAANPDVFLVDFALYHDFLAVTERSQGLRRIRVLPAGGTPFSIAADEPTYTMALEDTPDPAATGVRYRYESLTTPPTTYQLEVATGVKQLLKATPVRGGFDRADYVTEYLHAPARDGASVPISVVYRKGVARAGAPLYLLGYGAYGASYDPEFDLAGLSLLDRGFVYAIAHVRGGQELGRRWYDDGRLLHKMNTFTDFIDVTRFLIDHGYAAPDKVFASGASAGGLLIGAVANLRPDLYRGLVAEVPFVDAVTTMLDPSIPLTTNEFDEWGNPAERVYYDYIHAYSPYDNVAARGYPSMLVTTGMWDSQVQYFEPAKWVAKLRALKTDDNLLILHVNMVAGHSGRSGRFERFQERAHEFAFLLQVLDTPDRRGGAGARASSPRGTDYDGRSSRSRLAGYCGTLIGAAAIAD